MRIMHISTRLILGGSQENTVLSCEGQASEPYGHDVALVFGPIYGPEGSLFERARDFRASGGKQIQMIQASNLLRALHPLKDPRCHVELRRLIRAWKPDVVHTHSSKAGVLGRLAAWRERVPCIVHTVHGPPFHRYEKRWRNGMYILAERIAARRCHRIICVAEAMRAQFLAAGIGRPDQYEIVYSGMEVDRFVNPRWARDDVRRELCIKPQDVVIGTIARLAEHKGHDDLLDALGPVMRQRPSLKLLWVGDGWWRQRLMARVKSMNLLDRVMTTGLVRPEEIPKYLQAMDLLVHPSYREGLPRTVTQGLLSGLAAVAYDVDGTREVCIDGQTGRLVRLGDRGALRETVQWLIDHPAERVAMGLRGREFCRTRFSARDMVARLEGVYKAVLHPDNVPERDGRASTQSAS